MRAWSWALASRSARSSASAVSARGAFAFESGDVLSCRWVVPAQLSLFPSQVQVQRGVVALQAAFV